MMKVPASLLALPTNASRHASLFLPLLLSAAIGTELARIAMSLVVGSHPPVLPPTPPALRQARAPVVNVAAIASAALFGRLQSEVRQNPDDAPASTGSLKLVGTLAGRDPAAGFALISDDGKASVLKTGQDQAGVVLRYVYADHVIVDRGGTLENLALDRAPPGADPRPVKATPVAVARPGPRQSHRRRHGHRRGHRHGAHGHARAPHRPHP